MTSGAGENQNNKYILSSAYGDFVLLVRNLGFFGFFNRKYHNNQRDRVLPHQFKPESRMQTSDSGDESAQNSMKGVSRLRRKSTMCLRPKIVSALETPSWCKCEHCTLKPRTIELFKGCCDEALEYDEYDAPLKDTDAQLQDEKCLTHTVTQNSKRTHVVMLLEEVVKIYNLSLTDREDNCLWMMKIWIGYIRYADLC